MDLDMKELEDLAEDKHPDLDAEAKKVQHKPLSAVDADMAAEEKAAKKELVPAPQVSLDGKATAENNRELLQQT